MSGASKCDSAAMLVAVMEGGGLGSFISAVGGGGGEGGGFVHAKCGVSMSHSNTCTRTSTHTGHLLSVSAPAEPPLHFYYAANTQRGVLSKLEERLCRTFSSHFEKFNRLFL